MQERLQKILDEYDLNSSRLADKLGVQRSGISHIMAGRNKPSFDFLTGLLRLFPEIDANWLLTGKGDMFKNQADTDQAVIKPESTGNKGLFDQVNSSKSASQLSEKPVNIDNKKDDYKSKHDFHPPDEVESVIILLKNGKFKSYNQE